MRALFAFSITGALLAVQPARAGRSEDFQRELAWGLLLVEQGKHAEALARLRRARALDPTRWDVLVRIAVLEARLGEDARAERHLREVLVAEPRNADALRELGALLVARGRAAEAEPLLARAAGMRPADGVARYYLGLVLHLLRRDDAARQSLEQAIVRAPALASQAHYQLGLSYARAGVAAKARDHLDAAVRAGTDPAAVSLAREAMLEMERRAPPPKRWDVAVTLGASYDSNVSLLPDLAGDLPLPPGTQLVGSDATFTTAAAARLYTELAFEGRPVVGRHTIALGAGFYQSKHIPERVEGAFDPPTFDLTAFGAYATYALDGRSGTVPLRFELAAGHVEYFLDTFRSIRHYLQRSWARPSLTVSYASWGSLRVSYRFAAENYLSGNEEGERDDRDGFEHLGVVESFFVFGRRFELRLALFGGLFGADGDQWDALVAGGTVDTQIRILPWISLWLGLDYLHRDFGNSSYTVTGSDLQALTVERVDNRIAAFGRLALELSRFSVGFFYTFMRNASSARQIFEYTRHIAGMEVGFRY